MLHGIAQWLDSAGSFVFWACAALLVAVDGAAVATVAVTRSRTLVNRWTGPVLVANAVLLGGATVLPVAMRMTSAAITAMAPSVSSPLAPAVDDAAVVELRAGSPTH